MKYDILGTFRTFSLTSKKTDMNPFSGSTNLWTILGEYEPFNMLLRQCKGLLSGSYGPKTGQNCMKYEVLGTV